MSPKPPEAPPQPGAREDAAPELDPFAAAEDGEAPPPPEDDELSALAQALRLSQGFKLFLVRHDGPEHRARLLEALQARLPGQTLVTVHFAAPIDHLLFALRPHLLFALRPHLPSPRPLALCLTGLEASIFDPQVGPTAPRTSVFLANLNAARNSFPDEVGCPLLIWLTEYTLSLLARDAPDFFSIRSGYFRFYGPRDTSAAYQGGIVRQEDLRRRAQHAEAQADRLMQAGRSLPADFWFRRARSAYQALVDRVGEARIDRKEAQSLLSLNRVDPADTLLRQAEDRLRAHLQGLSPDPVSPHTPEQAEAVAELARILFERGKLHARAGDEAGLVTLRDAAALAQAAGLPELAQSIEQSRVELLTQGALRGPSSIGTSPLGVALLMGAAAIASQFLTGSGPLMAKTSPTRASVRRLLSKVLPSSSDLDAFALDHFPSVHRRFSSGMGRLERTNRLLEMTDPRQIVAALRESYPEQVRRYESLLESERDRPR